ncbi:MAG: hypothetical protein LBH00_06985 [Planctomycetaceae bacterium]|jgi:hypothetical protein|nr:hypothetical protein [Planctomycetaceae bacterium]
MRSIDGYLPSVQGGAFSIHRKRNAEDAHWDLRTLHKGATQRFKSQWLIITTANRLDSENNQSANRRLLNCYELKNSKFDLWLLSIRFSIYAEIHINIIIILSYSEKIARGDWKSDLFIEYVVGHSVILSK